MNECPRCGREFTEDEAAKVHAKFDTSFGPSTQSDMCWKCADNWEPGDRYYEGLAEKLADQRERERRDLKDAGR